MDKKEQLEKAKEAVRLAEKGGNFDTVHHEKLAALMTKKKPARKPKVELENEKAIEPPKEDNDAEPNR